MRKKNIDNAIQKLLKTFQDLCEETKLKLFQELDEQVPKLKCNYQMYKTKLETFYNKDRNGNSQTFASKDQIIQKIEFNKKYGRV